MNQGKFERVGFHHHHIDNGGVTVQIDTITLEDGYKEIYLKHQAEYFGYPGINTELRIDNLGAEWLRKTAMMYLEAAIKLESKTNES